MPRIEFQHLSPRERLDLIEALWDSLDDKDIPLTPAQADELDRRAATADGRLHAGRPTRCISRRNPRRWHERA